MEALKYANGVITTVGKVLLVAGVVIFIVSEIYAGVKWNQLEKDI